MKAQRECIRINIADINLPRDFLSILPNYPSLHTYNGKSPATPSLGKAG